MKFEADQAISAFARNNPEYYFRCQSLLDPLLRFFVDSFDFNVAKGSLPEFARQESSEQRKCRIAVVYRMMREFRRLNPGVSFKEDRDFGIFTNIIYWYLNYAEAEKLRDQRGQRSPVKDLQDYDEETIVLHALENMISRGHGHLTSLGHFLCFCPSGLTISTTTFLVWGATAVMTKITRTGMTQTAIDTPALNEAVCGPPSDDEVESDTMDLPALKQFFILPTAFINRSLPAKEPLEVPPQMAPLSKVSHKGILEKILEETAKNHSKRYGEFLSSETGTRVRTILEDALTDKVK